MKNGINNKVVTSLYDLHYIEERGRGLYKAMDLLSKTIKNIIFSNFEYVIYTDSNTFNKHNLSVVFNQPNVTIKIQELNGEFYKNTINPLRIKKVLQGNIWDRIHCVENYIECMYNKFEFLLQETENYNGNLLWIDAGLFGTSCGNEWRNYIAEIAHSSLFLEKVFEKINNYGFISLKGNQIVMNYEDKEKIKKLFNIDCFIIPGGFFGGRSDLVKKYFLNYRDIIKKIIQEEFFVSDQEILCITLSQQQEIHFFEHNDWDDLQRGVLKVMDLYDETKYFTNRLYNVLSPEKSSDLIFEFKQRTNREILNEILNVPVSHLNKIDLSVFDEFLNQMTGFASYVKDIAGKHHYRLLAFISSLLYNELVLDISADNGCSGLSLSFNDQITVNSYDIVYRPEISIIKRKNFNYFIKDILIEDKEKINQTRFIVLDTLHDGIYENKLYHYLIQSHFKGILFLDDIHLNNEMKSFWNNISHEKHDITRIGHNTGTGIVIFE